MALVVLDPNDQKRLIRRRRRLGLDQHDEVWNGVYIMSPMADDPHQDIAAGLTSVFWLGAGLPKGTCARAGVNVSDRVDAWEKNYRCPDVVVFLPDTKAVCHGAFWLGGPDFAVEIRSRGDQARKKLPFYASVGTRELLIVDRKPWRLELYRLDDDTMRSTGVATIENGLALPSNVLPVSFRLVGGEARPSIEVLHHDGRSWIV